MLSFKQLEHGSIGTLAIRQYIDYN